MCGDRGSVSNVLVCWSLDMGSTPDFMIVLNKMKKEQLNNLHVRKNITPSYTLKYILHHYHHPENQEFLVVAAVVVMVVVVAVGGGGEAGGGGGGGGAYIHRHASKNDDSINRLYSIYTNPSLPSPIRVVAVVGSWVECGCGELGDKVLGWVHVGLEPVRDGVLGGVGWELGRDEILGWVGW